MKIHPDDSLKLSQAAVAGSADCSKSPHLSALAGYRRQIEPLGPTAVSRIYRTTQDHNPHARHHQSQTFEEVLHQAPSAVPPPTMAMLRIGCVTMVTTALLTPLLKQEAQ